MTVRSEPWPPGGAVSFPLYLLPVCTHHPSLGEVLYGLDGGS